jgi:phospholipid/cholesterol/gamma-HCH transport system permease protein
MAAPSAAGASLAVTGEGERLALEGALDIRTLAQAREALARLLGARGKRSLDLARLESLDTPGALFLCGLRNDDVSLTGVRGEHQALLDLVCRLEAKALPKRRRLSHGRELLVQLGRSAEDMAHDAVEILTFIGRSASSTLRAVFRPRYLSLAAISRQVCETGIDALPIIGLMAVMIAVVIGYQGVAQLRPYGGEEFTVNLVAVSVLREMGVLITAIMVAGRSGSAFTAEIGVMRAREEIDALRVMGLDPMEMLVVPRILALAITLPLLTFFADVMGIAGGAGIAHFQLGISPTQYLLRVHQAADVRDLAVGLIKAPVFAAIIAVIGCMHGMRVSGSAESVGRETTKSVVKSIFLVIVLDAFFSIFFDKVGL